MKKKLIYSMTSCIVLLSAPSWADSALDLRIPTQAAPLAFESNLLLARADNADAQATPATRKNKNLHADFEESAFTPEKFHQYLGLTTLGLVALTAALPKEEDGPHEYAATLAAATASATVANGLIFHWEDFDFEDGFSDPDNLHMMLGTLGAVLMVAAVSQAPEGGHAGLGMAGGVAMGTAIKITW